MIFVGFDSPQRPHCFPPLLVGSWRVIPATWAMCAPHHVCGMSSPHHVYGASSWLRGPCCACLCIYQAVKACGRTLLNTLRVIGQPWKRPAVAPKKRSSAISVKSTELPLQHHAMHSNAKAFQTCQVIMSLALNNQRPSCFIFVIT